jgi:protein-S-isoprenylcysteine O-methyltransferase Ste14
VYHVGGFLWLGLRWNLTLYQSFPLVNQIWAFLRRILKKLVFYENDKTPMLPTFEHWLKLLATLTGIAVILIPLLGFRHAEVRVRGRSSGAANNLLRWPVMLAFTVGYVLIGIALWRPLTIILLPALHIIILTIGSLLYFPSIALYLWGFWTLGQMFGISSGFGATLYQDHHFIRNGPYRYVRHPMYLAVILAAFGALLIFRTWAMILFSILSLGVIVRAQREERLLADEFGEEWDSYCREVNGWLPKLRKRVQ